MDLPVPEEFRAMCTGIVAEEKDAQAWAEIESDDMFQSPSFVGGYDADEEAFCFSYYGDAGVEYWFQLTLEEVRLVADGTLNLLDVRPAEIP